MTYETPIPYRLRSEIEWTAIRGRRRDWWVAIDPLRSQLFRCGDDERRLLLLLDGRRGAIELQRLLSQDIAGKRISSNAILQIVHSAIQKQLLVTLIPNGLLADRKTSPESLSANASSVRSQTSSIASWFRAVQRWPYALVQGKKSLGNPGWFLRPLAGRTDWLFSGLAVRLWSLLIAASMLLVLTKLTSQTSMAWPDIATIRSNATSYVLILFITRILHELGHAIVCARMGARCREFGLFLMLGIACPYVDVTDSWRLKNGRERMAVAAAGVYVEWVIAAIAGLIWYVCQPGWLPTIAWQVMAVCSVTTLLINANPLMRYDGYFLLSDFLEVTNLREEADFKLKFFAQAWLIADAPTRLERWPSIREWGLIAYASASWVYRSTLILGLVCAVVAMAAQWNVPLLGWAFASLSILSFLLIPIGQMMFQSWSIARKISYGPFRLAAMWLSIVALIASIASIPLPHRIACRGSVLPETHNFVYTQAAGRIPLDGDAEFESNASNSQAWLVALQNPWLADQAHIAAQRQKQLECQVATLRQAAYQQPAKIDQLPTFKTLVSIAEKQSLNVCKELDALKIAKPTSGAWIPIALPSLGSLEGDRPSTQNFTIDSKESRGRWLPAGTPIGYIAPSDRVVIALTVPVSQLNNIQLGMPARVRFDQQPDRVYSAEVLEISGMTAAPNEIASSPKSDAFSLSGGTLMNDSNISISLTVEGVLQNELAMGGTAEAVIWSQPQSLYQHAKTLLGTKFGPSGPQIVLR